MLKLAKKFWNDEQGLELSEYAVMAALIIMAVVSAVILLRTQIINAFTGVAGTVESAQTAP
jgi:Flp pilus assembly pilin Flp